MTEKLTNKEMDQLEKWIGTGPKSFTLLYAITRDGCDAKTFHDKCDDQGPTVTVLYNTEKSVYGGYNPINWQSRNAAYEPAEGAFLFQLRNNGNEKNTMFTVKKGNVHALYNKSSYGPTFGGGHDLHTFNGTIKHSGSHFPLNGYANYGHSYEMNGASANDINNGHMKVTELEVYKVTYDEEKKTRRQWRDIGEWNKKLLDTLKDEITAFKPVNNLNITEARIAMIGPVGAGKSSLYNTIESIFRGRITKRACSGSAERSITTGYTPYMVRTESESTLKFLMCDTPGLEDSEGLDADECGYLLDGNIPNFYKFNSKSPMSPDTEGYEACPAPGNIIHCVVFVLDATTLDVLTSEVMEKMKTFKCLMNDRGIPQLIILTKIDKLCKDVEDDVSLTYKSWVVEEQVEKAAQLLGLPRSNVHPVKSYEKELELDTNINILALLALRQILHSAEDLMLNLLDRQRLENITVREN